MTAVYRVPLETELAYLDQKMSPGEAADVLTQCVKRCHSLAQGELLTELAAQELTKALTHPAPEVWGPAYAWLQPLLPRVADLPTVVRQLWRHEDPGVRLRLLHWRVWPDMKMDVAAEAESLPDDTGDSEADAALAGLLEEACPRVRFEAVLLTHQALGAMWGAKAAARLQTSLGLEPCPAVQALLRAVPDSRKLPSAMASRARSRAAVPDRETTPLPPQFLKLALDRMPGGQMPGAWLSFRFEPQSFLREQLDHLHEFKDGYDRLPGQGRHVAWCRWWESLRELLLAAQASGDGREPTVPHEAALRTLTDDLQRLQAREYHEAHCPQCGRTYPAMEMRHQPWQGGHAPLAMAGGFQIRCPRQHLLFTERMWRS